MAIEFRPLRADEIECRIGQVSKSGKGLSLLLYKTGRTDMDVLDETVGPENWQCKFYEIKGTLFCSTGIRVTREDGSSEWIWKDDAGTPSNIEAAKGEASDCRKRSGVAWGIGRELYTAPFVWVNSQNCNIRQNGSKYQCYDNFSVERVETSGGRITYLAIRNDTTGRTVFVWGQQPSQPVEDSKPSTEQLQELSGLVEELAKLKGVDNDTVIGYLFKAKSVQGAGVADGNIRTATQAAVCIGQMKAWISKEDGNGS